MERYGTPLTEEQRAARHFELTGETTPPVRGTGKATLQTEDAKIFGVIILLAGAVLLAAQVWFAHKQGWI